MPNLQSMRLTLPCDEGQDPVTIYSSQFDPKTGAIVRAVEVKDPRNPWEAAANPWKTEAFRNLYPERYWSGDAFSPVPETVDISITDRCNFGCTYCYQDSRPRRKHAPGDLVEKVIAGFQEPPYQIAIGGGEPTEHPDFPTLLKRARALGTIPNFTTNGARLTEDAIQATNRYAGGVAMTYHRFRGLDWFVHHYKLLREKLTCQLNIHVIADMDVAKSLIELCQQTDLGKLRIVLLAYYPDVGRATMNRLLTKRVYSKDLPEGIARLQSAGHDVAFSEGLLPYVLSRPELGIDSRFFMRTEGRFSCYVDPRGRMSKSSFDPPSDREPTIWDTSAQELWNKLRGSDGPTGAHCRGCAFESRCSTPHDFHYLTCAFAGNNGGDFPRSENDETEEP